MRPVLALFLLPLLIGCRQEPTFDERYDAAQNEIMQKADELDAEIEQREGTAVEDETKPEEGSGGTPPCTATVRAFQVFFGFIPGPLCGIAALSIPAEGRRAGYPFG